ncbi:PTS transporter subunit EIIB [Pseudomonas sp. TH34]|jgi:PTS system N-acetylglucosamine-specific IIB component|uniref:PTS transporter subunit EIIB n=1 Tax=Pseudomonas TaxID=286 RepID=UPI00087CFBBC|nr:MULTISPECIES: PTS transporter subunit EIIB [Pseudomonas]MBK5409929.1 PTS transporter subunit EIIB [Pseudomonas sp. TH34]WVN18251.1 PTS transporter subunit EIIB [Pseudomonas yamanorum]SDU09739.1 Phosphotransferase system IIB components [Pseudomonas yamanorum]
MFEKFQRAFWKALTPDLVLETPQAVVASAGETALAPAVLNALGGAENLTSQQRVALTRVRVQLKDAGRLDANALKVAGVPGVMVLAGGVVHLLTGLNTAL